MAPTEITVKEYIQFRILILDFNKLNFFDQLKIKKYQNQNHFMPIPGCMTCDNAL